ncbi:hypothetical protein HPB50_018664 [Hyalomma asiaticum]|uniref:Uncharacterized protein n=1 Tax=Hyalomma asiaticum TaxID=266040 RepID=A0ACB7SG95_HYAAI|nr:hypothetical protein HPB50_018664 [Hyalomma asiaticum]
MPIEHRAAEANLVTTRSTEIFARTAGARGPEKAETFNGAHTAHENDDDDPDKTTTTTSTTIPPTTPPFLPPSSSSSFSSHEHGKNKGGPSGGAARADRVSPASRGQGEQARRDLNGPRLAAGWASGGESKKVNSASAALDRPSFASARAAKGTSKWLRKKPPPRAKREREGEVKKKITGVEKKKG